MSDYLSEKEQIEMIKKWWRNYGVVILVAIVIGLAVGLGWRYWHSHRIEKTEAASVIYIELQNASAQQQYNTSRSLATQLMTQYKGTPYAGMAALVLARHAVLQNDLKAALEPLQWAVKNSRMKSVKQIARIRAARVLLAEKQYQPALDLLKIVDDPTYQPLIDKVKGDIYRALGKNQLADQAYQASKNGFDTNGITDNFLDMKMAQ